MNSYGKTSELKIVTAYSGGKTVMEDAYFTAPFKITAPFYPEKSDFMKIMPISVSAGIMEGDTQSIEVTVKENSKTEIVSQAYEKIHKMKTGFAERKCRLVVEKNACLFYTPLPCIPFEMSSFKTEMNVSLADKSSQLFLSDIITCGRMGFGERFSFSNYESTVNAECGEELIYADKTKLNPGRHNLESFGFYEGFTHLAAVFIANFPFYEERLNGIREIINEEPSVEGGASLTFSKDICVKLLGASSQSLMRMVEKIKKL